MRLGSQISRHSHALTDPARLIPPFHRLSSKFLTSPLMGQPEEPIDIVTLIEEGLDVMKGESRFYEFMAQTFAFFAQTPVVVVYLLLVIILGLGVPVMASLSESRAMRVAGRMLYFFIIGKFSFILYTSYVLSLKIANSSIFALRAEKIYFTPYMLCSMLQMHVELFVLFITLYIQFIDMSGFKTYKTSIIKPWKFQVFEIICILSFGVFEILNALLSQAVELVYLNALYTFIGTMIVTVFVLPGLVCIATGKECFSGTPRTKYVLK